jgi:hypothetical protein
MEHAQHGGASPASFQHGWDEKFARLDEVLDDEVVKDRSKRRRHR